MQNVPLETKSFPQPHPPRLQVCLVQIKAVSHMGLSWVQLSQGTQCGKQGGSSGMGSFKARNQDRLAFATAWSRIFIHRIWYTRIVQKRWEIHHIWHYKRILTHWQQTRHHLSTPQQGSDVLIWLFYLCLTAQWWGGAWQQWGGSSCQGASGCHW